MVMVVVVRVGGERPARDERARDSAGEAGDGHGRRGRKGRWLRNVVSAICKGGIDVMAHFAGHTALLASTVHRLTCLPTPPAVAHTSTVPDSTPH